MLGPKTSKGEISELKMCWLLWRQRIEIKKGRIVMLVSNPEADRKAPYWRLMWILLFLCTQINATSTGNI